jgi:superfamily II DNA/RNA helicase
LSGTAITIVAPIDQKAVGAIERLIGQTIPWMGDLPAPAEPRESRSDSERKPHGERQQGEHHRGGGNRGGRGRHPQRRQENHQNSPPARASEQPRPRPQPAPAAEDTDGSHLPAFLLRPVPAKA